MEKSQIATADAISANDNPASTSRHWPGGRKILIAAAVVAAGGGIVLNWGWLVAAGIAPLILAVLPCVAMCALGLCANKLFGGGACSTEQKAARADSAGDPGAPELPPAGERAPRAAAPQRRALDDDAKA